ncbi:DUF169 domain-containing protein [Georgenia yuyongxinii]|uniref:DUF169 domain-containing protein n=1 Tax=Georgenia yuyongxinii TaxID=2589797 RepID=UPI00143D670B|nr:DUF169 domain-containing protein [Georgenia yuyongxinii]
MALTSHALTFDAADASRLAQFWSAALGRPVPSDVAARASSCASGTAVVGLRDVPGAGGRPYGGGAGMSAGR